MPVRVPLHPFDFAHNVDCGGLIHRRSLVTGHPHDSHGTAYWGTAPSLLRGALSRWTQTLAAVSSSPEDFIFLDIGCGKGRALLLASELPFRRILGVELNPWLAGIAEKNILQWTRTPHPCNRIEALHADALEFPLPEGPLLIYLYNPFNATVMERLLERLEGLAARSSHPVHILYARPDHADLFERLPQIETLWQTEIPYTAEDTAADAFETTQQQCFLYSLHPPDSSPHLSV